jgi:secondary thiamine-phosphate synthase enzyme
MTATQRFKVQTEQNRQVIDVTDQVQSMVASDAAAITVFVAHTTCAVTTADLDPGTDLDLLDAVWEMIPKLKYRHPHDPSHVPAHLASSIIGPSVTVPGEDGKLILGTWQRIILVELDGPRQRDLVVVTFKDF